MLNIYTIHSRTSFTKLVTYIDSEKQFLVWQNASRIVGDRLGRAAVADSAARQPTRLLPVSINISYTCMIIYMYID